MTAAIEGMYVLSRPIRKKIGGYIEQDFDAYLTYRGVMWYRVEGGLGNGYHPREDWIANLPEVACSANRSVNHGKDLSKVGWGYDKSRTMEEQMDYELERALEHTRWKIKATQQKLADLERSRTLLEAAETLRKDQ